MQGADQDILNTLGCFGLEWDETPIRQSRRLDRYQEALNRLKQQNLLFPCLCSRKGLARLDLPDGLYPGFCRNRNFPEAKPHAIRLRALPTPLSFLDRHCGRQRYQAGVDFGDLIVKRRDNIIAYTLAVVIDDHDSGITDIVRGGDLLAETGKHLYLNNLLDFQPARYLHLSILTDANGAKLSKQTFADAVDPSQPGRVLYRLLQCLNQAPPKELADEARPQTVLDWAVRHWRPEQLPGQTAIRAL